VRNLLWEEVEQASVRTKSALIFYDKNCVATSSTLRAAVTTAVFGVKNDSFFVRTACGGIEVRKLDVFLSFPLGVELSIMRQLLAPFPSGKGGGMGTKKL